MDQHLSWRSDRNFPPENYTKCLENTEFSLLQKFEFDKTFDESAFVKSFLRVFEFSSSEADAFMKIFKKHGRIIEGDYVIDKLGLCDDLPLECSKDFFRAFEHESSVELISVLEHFQYMKFEYGEAFESILKSPRKWKLQNIWQKGMSSEQKDIVERWFELHQDDSGKVLMASHREIATSLEVYEAISIEDLIAQMEYVMKNRSYVVDVVVESMDEERNAVDPDVD